MVPRSNLELRDYHPAQQLLVDDVVRGLQGSPKRLSPMYLYDETGSQLFDRICTLPEYYPTRTETDILQTSGAQIARAIGANALLVELGSGSSVKTRLLLDRLQTPAGYVPVDISRSHLMAAARAISAAYPALEVLPVCADFTQAFSVPRPQHAPRRNVVFFPGSTIGNFDRGPAIELLRVMHRIAGPAGAAVIGVDLIKDRRVLERAYDDAAGVTAAFNLNVLRRLNREFGADFHLDAFRHEAVWVEEHGRIEMHLVTARPQTVTIGGQRIELAAGEHLVTEHCHKYTEAGFGAMAQEAGWSVRELWTDAQRRFSVQYLERA